MKRVMFLLFIAVVVAGVSAADVKVAPTQAVVDYLVSRGADAAAIQMAKANAPSEALFLAPGAPSKEAMDKILKIVDQQPLDTTGPEYLALGYDPRDQLNAVVFGALNKLLPSDGTDYTTYSMQIGDMVWSVSHSVPDASYNG
jgi:hypothetical protein